MDTMEETIKQAKFGSGKVIKKYIDAFVKYNLEEDEKLLDMAVPTGRPTDLLFVTDRRVFYFKMNSKDTSHNKILDYNEIQKVELNGDEEKADLTVTNSQGDIVVESVFLPVAEKVKESIEERMVK